MILRRTRRRNNTNNNKTYKTKHTNEKNTDKNAKETHRKRRIILKDEDEGGPVNTRRIIVRRIRKSRNTKTPEEGAVQNDKDY